MSENAHLSEKNNKGGEDPYQAVARSEECDAMHLDDSMLVHIVCGLLSSSNEKHREVLGLFRGAYEYRRLVPGLEENDRHYGLTGAIETALAMYGAPVSDFEKSERRNAVLVDSAFAEALRHVARRVDPLTLKLFGHKLALRGHGASKPEALIEELGEAFETYASKVYSDVFTDPH